ncbi:hypothetical protein H0H81_005530, partial [Sphagnurus paluster]
MAAPARHMPFRGQNSAPTLVTGANGVPELARFFTDVEYLFEDCQINADADKKRHILRYLELQDSRLWESLPTFAAGTYAAWKNEVRALYPGTSEERRYSVADLHVLVGEWNMRVISNIVQLGEFHRAFLNISQFLMSHNRLSENERDRAFRMAFTPDQWDKIHHRLVIADINHHPDDPWPMPQILRAAEYILHGTAPPMIPVQQPAPVPAQSAPAAAQEQLSVKDEAILALLSKFMDKFDAAPPRQQAQQPRAPRIGADDCHFCGEPGHRIRDCQQVGQAVRDGKCQRNHEGRIVLPSGAFVPSNTPGDNIKAKIDEWHRRNPGQLAAGRMTANAGTMLYEVNQVLSYDAPPPPPPAVSAEEQIRLLQQEVLALRSGRKMAFDGVNVPRAPPAPRQPAAQPAPPAPPAPTASASRPPAPAPTAAPAPAPAAARSSNAPNATDKGKGRADAPAPAPNREAAQGGAAREDPIHPYANAGGNRYVPPNTRNLGAPPDRPRADPAYRTFAPIVDPLKSGAVFDRVLGSN